MEIKKIEDLKMLKKDQQSILLNLKSETWVKVNDTALKIIDLVDDLDINDAIMKIVEDFKVSREQAEAFINYMVNMDVLQKVEEFNHIKLLDEDENPRRPIAICYLHITNKCNLTCGYCSYNANDEVNKEVPSHKIKTIIRKLSLNRFGQVVFSGGEPLLRNDFSELVQYAKRFFDDIGLVTNGTMINRENAKFIAENIDKIQISLDSGIQEEHDAIRGKGSFEKTIRGIKLIKENGHNEVKITPTVNKLNIKNIESIVKIAKELDVILAPRFFLPVGRGSCNENVFSVSYEEMVDAFKRIWLECERLQYDKYSIKSFYDSYSVPKISCNACKKIVCVDTNGDVYPCSFLMEESFKMGNILESTSVLDSIEKNCKGKDILERSIEKIDKCKDCEVSYFCGGGCMAVYFSETGEVTGADRKCEHFRQLLSNLIWNTKDGSLQNMLELLHSGKV